jgi:hypothetical protein
MGQGQLDSLLEVVAMMKKQRLPSSDLDVLYRERGDANWSGTEYNASASELEAFNDGIGDNGIHVTENIGETAEFGDGYVEIAFIYQESSEENDVVHRLRAYKLDFQCDVSLVLCVFEEGEESDGDIDWTERTYNYYDLETGSRDPSDESHGYFDEMRGDVATVEVYE